VALVTPRSQRDSEEITEAQVHAGC